MNCADSVVSDLLEKPINLSYFLEINWFKKSLASASLINCKKFIQLNEFLWMFNIFPEKAITSNIIMFKNRMRKKMNFKNKSDHILVLITNWKLIRCCYSEYCQVYRVTSDSMPEKPQNVDGRIVFKCISREIHVVITAHLFFHYGKFAFSTNIVWGKLS